MKTTICLLLTLLALVLPRPLQAAQPNVNDLLQKGLFEEEANQNLEAAIKNYQALIQQAEDQRKLVATAMFRLGECYRKQGRTNDAAAQYQRIVSDFPEQSTLANLSRQNLVGLGLPMRVEAAEHGAFDQYRNLTPAQRQELKKLLQDDLGLAEKSLAEAKKRVDVGVMASDELGQYQKQALGLKRQILAADGLATPEERKQYKDLVQSEIQIAEKAVEIKQRMAASGKASSEEVIKAQRDLLALKRELVLAESGPAPTSANLAPVPARVDEEERDIQRLQALLKDSPDLINAPEPGGSSNPPRLHRAVRNGQLKVAEFLLDHGADVNVRAGWNQTPLHAAVENGNKSMVEFLIAHGANVNARSRQGITALHQAADSGHKAIAEILLAHQANINAATDLTPPTALPSGMPSYGGSQALPPEWAGATSLHLAVAKGHQALVELLSQNGADVSAKNSLGRQPLHAAAQEGYLSIVQLLLAKNADINAPDRTGWTPLHLSVVNGHVETTELLLTKGANINALSMHIGNQLGQSPLHVAIERAQQGVFALLLKHKPDLNLKNGNGLPPLSFLLSQNNLSASAKSEMLGLLLNSGADVNLKNRDGDTPLLLVVRGNDLESLKMILAHKPDLEATNRWGATPLHEAVNNYNQIPIAEALIEAGANVNAVSRDMYGTPLMRAIQCFQNWNGPIPSDATRLIELLVAHQANVNYVTYNGATPLTVAKNLNISNTPGMPGAMPLPARAPVPYGSPQTEKSSGMTRADLAARIIEILKNAGANEAFERLNRIETTRNSETINSSIFSRMGTNDWNRYSLLEVIGRTYTQNAPGPRPGVPVGIPYGSPITGGPQVNSTFPDLQKVRITRWDLKTGKTREIPVNVDKILSSGDCSQDVWLEWGDAVEIPEADHKRDENWPGLSEEKLAALFKCLQRDVTIVVKGEKNLRRLIPFSRGNALVGQSGFTERLNAILVNAAGNTNAGTNVTAKVEVNESKPEIIELVGFRLKEVIELSKLLRTSSDTTRVKVKRVDPLTKENREFVLNLEKIDDPGKDLWLREGDVIEILEK